MPRLALPAAAVLAAGLLIGQAEAETVRIAIGHQSTCFDTYTGGIIVKELNLLPKFLPHDGKYKDATYDIGFSDYTSGPPITNMMLANKLDIGVMGDYPLIVNGAKFQETDSLRTLYVSGTGYNLKGSGNAGCNSWSAAVILRDDQIDFTDIVTTKKMCGKPEMKAEDAFLTSLRSAKRWHVDGDKLIIEGDAARLMLKPGVAELKVEKKPAKRRPR